jgi:hypothetical protein
MNQNEVKPKNSDEVDLTQFFRWIGQGFRNAGNSFLYFLASLRRLFLDHKVFFASIIISGLVLGFIYSEVLKKAHFKSSMVLGCDYLNEESMENTIDKLNLLASEKGREGLTSVLNIDTETAANILEFEFKSLVNEKDVLETELLRERLNNVVTDKKELIEKVVDRLEIDNRNAYEISVLVYDPNIVKSLETALVNYFKNNTYIKRRIESQEASLKDRKRKIEKESTKLDSLKQALYYKNQAAKKSPPGSNNVIVSDEASAVELFELDMDLNQELVEINEKLYLRPDFELIEGFTTFKEPESASLIKILFYSFLISWVMGYLIIGLWRFDKMLANYPTRA